MTDRDHCNECRYYVVLPGTKNLAGECHRYPPQIYLNHNGVAFGFPEMLGLQDWCGEFKSIPQKSPFAVKKRDTEPPGV